MRYLIAKKILVSLLCSAALLTGCSSNDPEAPPAPPAADITPNQFSFTDQTNVAAGTEITSAAVTITGIDAATPVSVVGGSYSINGGAFTTLAGTLNSGDTVQVRHTASATASTATNTTLAVNGVSDTFTSTTAPTSTTTVPPPPDTTPAAFSFTDQNDVATTTMITSAAVTITGIDSPASVTVSGGSYSVGCTTTFTNSSGTINNNQSVCVRHTSSASASTATNTVLSVGGVSDTFTSTTAAPPAADTTPAAFNFTNQNGVANSTVITSAPVTITGINSPAPVTVADGSYSIGCTGTFVSSSGTINNNQSVCVRHTSAAADSTATNTTLTVGGVSDTFTSTTAAPPAPDTTPSQFNFTDQSDVTPSTEITSAAVTITGINSPANVTVSGGSYSINGGAFTATAGTVSSGNTVQVRHTSSASTGTATNTTLTVGGVSDTFTSTTTAGPDTTPTQFNFVNQTGVPVSSERTSAPVTITGINLPAVVTVTGGTYSVGCTAAYTSDAGTITNNQTVCVRHTSAATASTATDTTLTVGGVSDTFTSTTAAPVDTTPAAFSFTDQTGVTVSTATTSAAVPITGINSPAAITVTGGTYSIGCGATFTSDAGTINNNQTVCVRHTSAATAGTDTNTVLTVGGVSDTFTSTTAGTPAGTLLPFLAGNGDLKVLDPTADIVAGTNPRTADSGLSVPATSECASDLLISDCYGKAQAFYTGAVSGTTVSNLRAARLAYIKGGAVYKLDLTQSLGVTPVQISSLTDACRIIKSETTDLLAIDNSAVVIERVGANPGADLLCDTTSDNVVTVIKLNSLTSSPGVDIPLVLTAGNPIHAQTDASGATTGYVSFEVVGPDSFRLALRGTDLSYQSELLAMEQTSGAYIERATLTHLFVTAIPAGNGLSLFRVESGGTLSNVLYFFGSNDGNAIQDGLHDATHLYFAHDNQLWRTPLNSITEGDAQLVVTLLHPDPTLNMRIIGNRTVDGGRVVFEAQNQYDINSVASGVFSVPVNNADAAPATTLANYPDSLGGSAYLLLATNGLAYINLTNHGETAEDALKISTAGGSGTTFAGSYWAGSNRATSFNLVSDFVVPTQYIFLAKHEDVDADGIFADTLSVVDPATGAVGIALGEVFSTGDFQAVKIYGLGRYALARAEIDRYGPRDNDVYFLDAETALSLTPLSVEVGTTDMPLGN